MSRNTSFLGTRLEGLLGSCLGRRLEHLTDIGACLFQRGPASTTSRAVDTMDVATRRLSGVQASTSGRGAANSGRAAPRQPWRPVAAAHRAGASSRRHLSILAQFSGGHRTGPRDRVAANAAAPAASSPALSPYRAGDPSPSPPRFDSRSFVASSGLQQAALPALEEPSVEDASASLAAFQQAKVVGLEGTVEKVQFRAEQTGYTVLKVALRAPIAHESSAAESVVVLQAPAGEVDQVRPSKARRPRKQVITVVGNLQQLEVGQSVRLSGNWIEHQQYGQQLRATDVQELLPSSAPDLVAYLGGGTIPGVGPVTAKRMVDRYDAAITDVLDSPDAVQKLLRCKGIGGKTAEKVKAGWDAGRGARLSAKFLRDCGVPPALAQHVAQRFGQRTVEIVTRDPYAALSSLNLPLDKVDLVAAKVGAHPGLVSRAAAAMAQSLQSAATDGHTYLPWDRLERECAALLSQLSMQHANPWPNPNELHYVAKHLHTMGALVAEPAPEADAGAAEDSAAPAPSPAAGPLAGRPPARSHPAFSTNEEVQSYVSERLPSVKPLVLTSLVRTHGLALSAVLDAAPEKAELELARCARVGAKTAEKVKIQWDKWWEEQNVGEAGGGSSDGLTMEQLLQAPAEVDFRWGGDVRCYSPKLHAAEKTVAEVAGRKAALARSSTANRATRIRKWIKSNGEQSGIELSAGQAAAIAAASDSPILVITGGPGCGKTTAVQTIVKLWCAQSKFVRICAPTGRAAQRMGNLQGIEPSTIHRMLKYQPRRDTATATLAPDPAASDDLGPSAGIFEHHAGNPLPADAVLVDEVSMLSLPLAAALMEALPPRCQLVLVGDVDQLPPVGPGAVLHSLISSGLVPVVDLREVFRQEVRSAIVTSALAVRRGDLPALQLVEPHPAALAAATSDACIVRAPSPAELPGVVHSTVAALAAVSGFVAQELQVITPMRKGPCGSAVLNPLLQALLNPPSAAAAELPRHEKGCFRVGDRVLQLVNNYDKDVFNGDQGRVVDVRAHEKALVVEFPHLMDREAGREATREYAGVELSQLELAYAVTVHKAQGGESKHVVLALSPQHGRMLTRRLLYTGLTRARERLVVVATGGADDPVAKAVRVCESDVRLSSLEGRLAAERLARGLPEQTPDVHSNEAEVLGQSLAVARASTPPGDVPLATETGGDGGLLQANLRALPALCEQLGVDAAGAAALAALSSLSAAPLAPADAIAAHVQALREACSKGGGLPALPELLQAAPALLVSSPEYFRRGLAFAQKVGALTAEELQAAPGGQEESLVDQLRRVLTLSDR